VLTSAQVANDREEVDMKGFTSHAAICLGAASLTFVPSVAAQTPARLTDKDVKALIETVDHGRSQFEDRLDGKVKDSILREPGREVNVEKFLDDFKENVEHLKDRFESKYAASAEAAIVLRQATAIDAFIKQQPTALKGNSEWHHLAVDLGRLAGVYGTTFPGPAEAPGGPAAVRRINDGEAAIAARAIEEHAEHFKDAVNDEHALAEPAKKRVKESAELVKERAEKLKSRLEDSKPATAEATLLFEALRHMEDAYKGLTLSSPSLNALGAIKAPLDTLHRAFNAM
jgi:hypothetical protein